MKIEEIEATCEWVIVAAKEVEKKQEEQKTKSGIVLLNQSQSKGQNVNSDNGKKTVDLFIHSIGPDAKEKVSFKKGDCVLCDPYDLQTIEDDEGNMYGICHYTKVKAIFKISR